MVFHLKRWHLLIIALVVALAVTLQSASTARAAEPGESNSWQIDGFSDNTPLRLADTLSEARSPNTGTLVRIWRGADNNNQVWISVGDRPAIPVGESANTSQTFVAPRVV